MNNATFVKSMKDIYFDDHHTIETWHGDAKLWKLTEELELPTISGPVTSTFVVTNVDPTGETGDVMVSLTDEEGKPLGDEIDFVFGLGAAVILENKGSDENALAHFEVEVAG